MNPNVVTEEYVELQKKIMIEQENIKKIIQPLIQLHMSEESFNYEIPVLPQLRSMPVPLPLYQDALKNISMVIKNENPDLPEEFLQYIDNLAKEQLVNYIKGTILFKTDFFQKEARQIGIDPWLPHFIAEQALRPFMHIVGEYCKPFLKHFDVMGTCPCCGEPPRIGKVEDGYLKVLLCPRCESKWKQKKESCVHCGEDREGKLMYISVEEEDNSFLEVCKTCRNYIKLFTLDSENEKNAALLDLESLHLDFVAHEEGYGDQN
ncbi:formate dehydrogenase accessory protein FdhE [Evansella sp. AB-rgal1]|uniref:formate dehydrogenase accessory protein FdhE n=1 Tax=Evansella sp. AB-rgal1 TaxID=3242696 RepID=UPI00359E195F